MPFEEGLVDGDVLDSDRTPITFERQDPVHQQHRVSMRHDPLDRPDQVSRNLTILHAPGVRWQ